MLIPLHVKSHHSRGVGTASPEQLVARAAQHGLPALALTDIDNLCGQPRFQELCRNVGIQPIIGVELRAHGPGVRSLTAGRLVLLGQDSAGYANLCRIVTAHRRAEPVAEPLRALTGSLGGLFVMTDDPALLERLLGEGLVDREDARLLLVRPLARDEAPLFDAAARLGVRLVADPEIALLDAEDRQLQALLVAALGNRRVSEIADAELEPSQLWFRSPDQQSALFADVPEAVDETVRVAEQCQFRLARERPVLPGADAFFGTAPERALESRCEQGLRAAQARGRCSSREYSSRLEHELSVIRTLGYAGYFMIAAEIAETARRLEIAVVARGSAVGSLVVHLLQISPIDPVAEDLYFERFLHERRTSPPDIDLDVCSERREELIRWVVRRFGRERVALVGAIPTFGFDSAIRSGLAALGANSEQIERFVAAIARLGAQAENEPKQVPAAAVSVLPASLRGAVPLLYRLIGKPRSLAMHPGGVVVGDRAIASLVPVEVGRDGSWVAQYDQRSIEQTGLTKLDLLGNRFLSQLQRTRVLTDGLAPRLHECPTSDSATLARIDRADTLGCFQIETPLLRSLLCQMHVRSIEDCAAALALVRPGPAATAAKRVYLAGDERPPLYDEDLIASLSAHGGISLVAADVLRTSIIDCDNPRELAMLQHDYVSLAADNGRDPGLARASFRDALKFAAYSFCKAHAWSYALLAYQSAYLKTHHLVEFGCALLDNYGGAYPLRTIAGDLQRSGARIVLPSINHSSLASTADHPNTILLGLGRIKCLRKASALAILEARTRRGELTSVEELTSLLRLRPQELRALILSGACDGLEELPVDAYPFAHEALLRSRGLTTSPPRAPRPAAEVDPRRLADYRALVRIRHELELLDMHVSDHPLRVLREQAQRSSCVTLAEARAHGQAGEPIRFAGLIAASRRHKTRSGVVEYLTFEDESGLLDAVISTHAYPRLGPVVTTPGPYLGEGRLHDDQGHRYVELGSLLPFHERRRLDPEA